MASRSASAPPQRTTQSGGHAQFHAGRSRPDGTTSVARLRLLSELRGAAAANLHRSAASAP